MTEPKPQSQYKTAHADATHVATELPDEFITGLMALQEQAPGGGCLWLARGRYLIEWQKDAPKHGIGIIQHKAADTWGVCFATVREDVRNTLDAGDWTDEMPDALQPSREQLRCARTEAALRKLDLLAVLQEQAEQSDQFGGRLCPPGKWRERIKDMKNGNHDDNGDVLGRIRGAASALTTAMKRAAHNERYAGIMGDLMTASAVVNDLLDKAEAQI